MRGASFNGCLTKPEGSAAFALSFLVFFLPSRRAVRDLSCKWSREPNNRTTKHINKKFLGLSSDFLAISLCFLLFFPRRNRPTAHINNVLTPAQSLDSPAKLFMLSGSLCSCVHQRLDDNSVD